MSTRSDQMWRLIHVLAESGSITSATEELLGKFADNLCDADAEITSLLRSNMKLDDLPIIVFSPITGLFEVCDSDVQLLHSLEQVEIVYESKVGVVAAQHLVTCGGETYCLSVEGQAQDVVSKFNAGEKHLLSRVTEWVNGHPRHTLVADPQPPVVTKLTEQEQLDQYNRWEDACMACDPDWKDNDLGDVG